MLKTSVLLLILVVFVSFLIGCKNGYVKKNGQWLWVTTDENYGTRSFPISGIDPKSFTVLDNANFAKDRYNVYFKGKKINYAHPSSFVCLTKDGFGYAKDANHVYLEDERILYADPNAFEVLDFPYAKDNKNVYNGTLPMQMDKADIAQFKVINDDKYMAHMISRIQLDHFVTYNEKYQWIKEQPNEIHWVIIGEWGSGRTNQKKFKGLYEIK